MPWRRAHLGGDWRGHRLGRFGGLRKSSGKCYLGGMLLVEAP